MASAATARDLHLLVSDLPLVTRVSIQVTRDSSVADLVNETSRLIASANYLVGGIEKNVASASRLLA